MSSLVEKLEAAKQPYRKGMRVAFNGGLDQAITIAHTHEAETRQALEMARETLLWHNTNIGICANYSESDLGKQTEAALAILSALLDGEARKESEGK